jgi:hypothetical protein
MIVSYSSNKSGTRVNNQDIVLATDRSFRCRPAVMFLDADGMGRMQFGDRATKIALDAVER